MDKERRKINIVVHNLPESQPSDFESREKQDLRQFQDLVKNALKLNVRPTKCFRVVGMQEGRPRLLVVTLEDLATKIELLRMSSTLRNISEWKHIYINPDQTPQEREVNRKLRQELASRREAGETNLVIRQGRIVKNHFVSRSGSAREQGSPVRSAGSSNAPQRRDAGGQNTRE